MWSDLRGHLMLLHAENVEQEELNARQQQGPPRGRGGHHFGQPPDLRLVPREGEAPPG